jgi:hypothetical protein
LSTFLASLASASGCAMAHTSVTAPPSLSDMETTTAARLQALVLLFSTLLAVATSGRPLYRLLHT